MQENQGMNNGTDGETTTPEASAEVVANAQVVAHGVSHPDGCVDLANATVQYSVYSSCLLLLSGLQLHFMCEEKGTQKKKKKKAGHSNEAYPENEKDNYNDQQKQTRLRGRASPNCHFLRDYEMYRAEQKRPQLNDQAACPIPLYKKR
ncbi:conserved Plasmodium protein, unknown function [Plasmodium vivax]|uniref:(malaria parasite P. vivax) hypothetical protein n=1 Tax=Plasmodium vivax TaxID=5855 RepID=A0A1G4H9U6_PLAVI|nr:unnamed protein product [Plasmodium vivax]SCO71665.1 conserved Plasmodium protein, unknown function [Plasmodium vivax]